MKDKVIVVTGGAAGIGRATALALAREGAKVIVSDVDDLGGRDTVRLIREEGGEAQFIRADVSKESDVADLFRQVKDMYGGLDGAFNNAGIVGEASPLADIAEEVWDRIQAVNAKGVFLCMKYEIPLLIERGGGAIVNNASVAGLVGMAGSGAYVASKHAVIGLTKTAALDYVKSNIRVNAVCPGVVRTNMVEKFVGSNPEVEAQLMAMQPIGRMGKPEEIANAVVWLLSDKASFVTGHALAVDGGFTA
ncbi:MAG TPA: SDR family oxidoreductase [Firmicutes bacterium]|nr:SDR family oxidoreductase [Bacillota bacterium]